MNLILLFDDDFTAPSRVRLEGRRFEQIAQVHRARAGKSLVVGLAGGRVGRGVIAAIDAAGVELDVALDRDPPAPLPLNLVVALPRPKVVNRVVLAAASLGVKRLVFVNAWKVEKAYWDSPRLDPANLRAQSILGLEQAVDTLLPQIGLRRLFRPFVENELPAMSAGTRRLVADPRAHAPLLAGCDPVTLVVGPEGGFVDREIASLTDAGFLPVSAGERILRVETVIPFLLARLF